GSWSPGAPGRRQRRLDASNQHGMLAVGRMDPDPQNLERHPAKDGCGGKGRAQAKTRPARPGDHWASGQLGASPRRPDPKVIFRDRDAAIAKRFDGTLTVEPGRRDEAVDPPADHFLEQRSPFNDSGR